MINVDMYEIGEEVFIKASVVDIQVEQGKIKYTLKAEHTNNECEHLFSDSQIIPTKVLVTDPNNIFITEDYMANIDIEKTCRSGQLTEVEERKDSES